MASTCAVLVYDPDTMKGSKVSAHIYSLAALLLAGAAPRLQAQVTDATRDAEIRELRQQLTQISQRLARLEGEPSATEASNPSGASGAARQAEALQTATAALRTPATAAPPALTPEDHKTLDFLNGTSFNVGLDGYYEYNFNQPIGRVNLLRAYDVISNSFSISQASVLVEHAPDPAHNRRFGVRLDLQYGQATETLQGGAQNELRPQVWRNIFQAYGTYVAPVGNGLNLDFGKWSSSLGAEGNYTKDQINYSRAYFFNFLPFYHMGVRANYTFNPKLNLTYWLVNGAQQTEDFNGFKSQAFLLNLKPASSLTWNANYYFGQEQRDTNAVYNPTLPSGPTQPGLPTANISPTPNGREHIFDSYATWTATPKLTLIGEGDYVVNRTYSQSLPSHVSGGAAYLKYQVDPAYALAGRAEYLSDPQGLFSGKSQALKETTITLERKLGDGFLMRAEWRRDFSNVPFFLTDQTGSLKHSQNTAGLGLVWWAGQKQGAW